MEIQQSDNHVIARPILIFFRQVWDGMCRFEEDTTAGTPRRASDLSVYPSKPTTAKALTVSALEVYNDRSFTTLYNDEKTFSSFDEIINGVGDVMFGNGYVDRGSHIYTIHAKSMLLRIARWGLLRQRLPAAELAQRFNKQASKTVDICEQFHYPAVLTYEDRSSFGLKNIQDVMNIKPEEHKTERSILEMFVAHCLT